MKEIPKFKNEDGGAEILGSRRLDKVHRLVAAAKRKKLVDLKPSLRTISLRLPGRDDRGSKAARETSAITCRINRYSKCFCRSGWPRSGQRDLRA